MPTMFEVIKRIQKEIDKERDAIRRAKRKGRGGHGSFCVKY